MEEAKIIEETTMIKPEFVGDIKAEITGIQNIEDNIKEVQEFAISLSEYYKDITFTENEIKQAKDEKANINKFKKKVSDFRKEITVKWNEPLQKFVETAKTTETMLTDTYTLINNQIAVYEDKTKQEKEDEIRQYFNELCEKEKINFLDFNETGITITLSASKKSLKELAKAYVEKTVDEIKYIKAQEHPEEIMIEYEKTKNLIRSIETVKDRYERLKQKEEEKEKDKELIPDEEMLSKIEEVLQAPVEKEIKEEIYEMTFTVKGTLNQLKELKEYMKERGLINE